MDDKIAALGEITLESKEAIEAAREAYNALSDAAKAKVTNLNTLIAAEKALADLQKPEPPKPILPVVSVAPVEDFIDVPAHAWCYDSAARLWKTASLTVWAMASSIPTVS